MFNPTPSPELKKRLNETPVESKLLLADILMEAILNSGIPEEAKIEVKIMQAHRELDIRLSEAVKGFGCPIPLSGEGEEVAKRIYPARQAFLAYLQLTKAGLENFLANVPVPDIPPEYRKRVEELSNPF